MKRPVHLLRRNRSRVLGTKERPRLMVYRSLRYTYGQLIDDQNRKVLLGVNERTLKGIKGTKAMRARTVGAKIAEKAKAKGITACVFDRRGYKYHGRIKALADGAREGGLQF